HPCGYPVEKDPRTAAQDGSEHGEEGVAVEEASERYRIAHFVGDDGDLLGGDHGCAGADGEVNIERQQAPAYLENVTSDVAEAQQFAARVSGVEHQSLSDASGPHGTDVE